MLEFTDFTPKVAVVTGAGRGLGRDLVRVLAAQGVSVAALGRTGADLEALAGEDHGTRVLPVQADVGDPDSLRAAFQRVDAELGPVDVLINNAAVYPLVDFLDESPESFAQALNINVSGVASCSKLALERMVPRALGRIVNLTSFAGKAPAHMSAAYSVSKGAVRILTEAMITDLGDRFPGIVINEWIPGALQTPMGTPDGIETAQAAKWGAALALWHDPALTGVVFVKDRESLKQLSLKRRLFNKATGRTPRPRVLSGRL